MFPLSKLAALPRHQRLRKAAKIFEGAELRLITLGKLPADEIEYLKSLANQLAEKEDFSQAAVELLEKAQSGFTLQSETRRTLNSVYHLLLLETGRTKADWDFINSPGVLDPSKRRPFAGMQVYLEDIRSPFNVGSMFRAAESFGAEKLWLSPFCADPRHKRAERTAMGCVDVLPWERLSHDPFAGQREKFTGEAIFALETGGTPLEDFPFPKQGILIAGSEELGVSPNALAAADASLGRVSISTYGAKGSLNVSVAFGIVMQAWASNKIKEKK